MTDLALGRPPRFEDLNMVGARRRPLRVARRDMGDPRAAIEDYVEIDDGANARLARVLGRSIGGVDLSFRLPRTPADRLLGNRLDRPLNPDDGGLAIEFAIDRHNKRVGSLPGKRPLQEMWSQDSREPAAMAARLPFSSQAARNGMRSLGIEATLMEEKV